MCADASRRIDWCVPMIGAVDGSLWGVLALYRFLGAIVPAGECGK